MTTHRLKMLERQAKAAPVAMPQGSLMEAMHSAMEAKMEAAVRAAKEQQTKAESKLEAAQHEIAALHSKLEAAHKEVTAMQERMHAEMKTACDAIEVKCKQKLAEKHAKMEQMEEKLTRESEARVKCEAELIALKHMHEQMKSRNEREPAPVTPPTVNAIMPPAAPMKPMTLTVSRRDSEGRIAAISITPST